MFRGGGVERWKPIIEQNKAKELTDGTLSGID